MIGVYYPYLAGANAWEELRYSLRSLEKFFSVERRDGFQTRLYDFEVWIVGDLPDWIQNVKHIPHKREDRVYSASTYDAVMKLGSYLDHPDTPERFIRMYVDIYFVGERCLNDLEKTRYLFTYDEYKNHKIKSGSGVWREQVNKTLDALKELGFAGYMTETHCPEVFEKWKMLEIFDMFAPAENRLLTSSLYYNVFPFFRMLKDRKTERALFYGEETDFAMGRMGDGAHGRRGDVAQNIAPPQGKYFLNHNDAGLDDGLKKYIMGMFPEKSRFEK